MPITCHLVHVTRRGHNRLGSGEKFEAEVKEYQKYIIKITDRPDIHNLAKKIVDKLDQDLDLLEYKIETTDFSSSKITFYLLEDVHISGICDVAYQF